MEFYLAVSDYRPRTSWSSIELANMLCLFVLEQIEKDIWITITDTADYFKTSYFKTTVFYSFNWRDVNFYV